MLPVLIESTLLLFFLMLNFLGSDIYLIVAVCSYHPRSLRVAWFPRLSIPEKLLPNIAASLTFFKTIQLVVLVTT